MPKTTSPRRLKVPLPGPGYNNRPTTSTHTAHPAAPAAAPAVDIGATLTAQRFGHHRSFTRTESAASTRSTADHERSFTTTISTSTSTERSTETEDSWSPVSEHGPSDSQIVAALAAYEPRSVYPQIRGAGGGGGQAGNVEYAAKGGAGGRALPSQEFDEMRLDMEMEMDMAVGMGMGMGSERDDKKRLAEDFPGSPLARKQGKVDSGQQAQAQVPGMVLVKSKTKNKSERGRTRSTALVVESSSVVPMEVDESPAAGGPAKTTPKHAANSVVGFAQRPAAAAGSTVAGFAQRPAAAAGSTMEGFAQRPAAATASTISDSAVNTTPRAALIPRVRAPFPVVPEGAAPLRPWLAAQDARGELSFRQDLSGDECRAYRMWGADRFLWLTLSQTTAHSSEMIAKTLLEDVVRKDENGKTITYKFFGSTDSKLKKNPTIGYFEERPGQSVHDLLNSFGGLQDVLNKSGPGKYVARLSLSFSSTVSAGALPEDQVVNLPDIENRDGSKVFSDGCGVIAEEFATELAFGVLKLDYVPSVFQFRRGGKKGILVKYPQQDLIDRFGEELRYKSVGFRPSQHKYDAPGLLDLEINSVSRPRPIRGRLTRFLILILTTLGIPIEVFKRLLATELERLKSVSTDREMALRYLEHEEHTMMTSLEMNPKTIALHMLHAGVEMKEPYLQDQLRKLTSGSYTQLWDKLKIPVPDTTQLFGCIDERAVLSENQVYVHVSGVGYLEGRILVTRSPCGHPGDVRVLTAKRPSVDPGFRDCIVFNTRGYQPLPDMMSGGDLDGDEFVVSWNSLIIPEKADQPDPRRAGPKAKVKASTTDPIKAVREHLAARLGKFDVGLAATAWEQAAETAANGVRDPYAIAYFKRYEVCLDVNKAGTEIPPEPPKSLKGPARKNGPIAILRKCISNEKPSMKGKPTKKAAASTKQSDTTPSYDLDQDLLPDDLVRRDDYKDHLRRFWHRHQKFGQLFYETQQKICGKNVPPAGIGAPDGLKKSKAEEEKDQLIRESMAMTLEEWRKEEFGGHPDGYEKNFRKAATFYFQEYKLQATSTNQRVQLDIAWLGIDYLLARKSSMVKHRLGGVGPAACIAPTLLAAHKKT